MDGHASDLAPDRGDERLVFILQLDTPTMSEPLPPQLGAGAMVDAVGTVAVGGFRGFKATPTGEEAPPGLWLKPKPPARLPLLGIDAVGATAVSARHGIEPLITASQRGDLDRFATEDITIAGTDPVDPHRWYDGRLQDAGSTVRSVGLSAFDGPAVVATLSTLSLINADGKLDRLMDNAFTQGSEATLAAGSRGMALNTYQTVATTRIRQVDTGLDTCEIETIGADYLLDAVYPETLYKGTGAAEGPPELTNVPKPRVLGRVYNVTPVLIDPVNYIFQVNDGPFTALLAARHGGVPLIDNHVNAGTFASLQAWPVTTGYVVTCKELGLIKPGITAAGTSTFGFTVDVEVLLVQASDIAYDLAERIRSTLRTDVDLKAFLTLRDTLRHAAYGRFLTETVTWRDVLDDVMRNLDAYYGINRLGALTAGRLHAPSGARPVTMEIGEHDVIEIDRLGLPDGYEWMHRSRTLNYKRNWTPNASLAVMGQSTDLSSEWRRAIRLGPNADAFNAVDLQPADTHLQVLADVEGLADRLLELHGVQRAMFSVRIPFRLWPPGELAQVRLTYPRFGLDAGRLLIVVGVDEDYDERQTLLTLWG